MGQIKNIKLLIVTDIKKTKDKKQQFQDERQVVEETHAKVETEEKKDARTIQVNNCCYGDGTTTANHNKHGGTNMAELTSTNDETKPDDQINLQSDTGCPYQL